MKLSTIINQARSGELKGLSVESITDSDIVNYINLAMSVLYARFPLKTNEAVLTLHDNKTIYLLDGTDEDVLSAGEAIKEDSVLELVQAFDEAGEIPLDDQFDNKSIFTTGYNQVQIPYPQDGAFVGLVYIESPDLISPTYVDGKAEDCSVPLPVSLLEPLLHYVGYRAHGSRNGNVDGENNTHLMRYEASCRRIEDQGLIRRSSPHKVNKVGGFLA
jgi:hypothetical protein